MRFLYYIFPFVFSLFFLASCGESSYLMQTAQGHWSLMSRARPIADILAQETESQEVREQLTKVLKLRDFAINTLHLPDTGSYQEYADLERPYAVWNLVVAPELSLDLNQWCFPVTGCVTYRGYFDQSSAHAIAKSYSTQGFEVDVYGVHAYSTLNWFDDPVLNTFLHSDDIRLPALLFHEMAHQVIYVRGDTMFNESFAKTVEMEGLRRWLKINGSNELWRQCLQGEEQSADFHEMLSKVRSELLTVYASEMNNDQKRSAKQEVLSQAYKDYEHLKTSWGGYTGFDAWMQQGLNNARLSSAATYHELVPAFQTLLQQVGYDLMKFYDEVKSLGGLPKDERLARMKSLSPKLKASLD